jgi:SRSO17 transposase
MHRPGMFFFSGFTKPSPSKPAFPSDPSSGSSPSNRWDHEGMRNKIQKIVAEHTGKHSVGIIDETSFVKKGTKTPDVQRQYCGTVGKQENCIITVHLAYVIENFPTLIDQDLFLPESWDTDRDRCRAAGIPDNVVYRPKWHVALEHYDRATSNDIEFEWLTFDEHYGSKPEFLRQLDTRDQLLSARFPVRFMLGRSCRGRR